MPFSSRGAGPRFRLFGFPVRIDPMFFIGAFLITYSSGVSGAGEYAALGGVLFGSVLAHELGHGFSARATGARPEIVLMAFGGITAFNPPRRLNRFEQIGISLAGPFTNLAIAGVALGIGRSLDIEMGNHFENPLLFFLIRVNLALGVLNLLPILPLDGGNVMQNLLPGGDASRARLAAGVSIALAAAAAVWGLNNGYTFVLIYAAILIAMNVGALSQPVHRASSDHVQAVEAALSRLDAGDLGSLGLLQRLGGEIKDATAQSGVKLRTVESLVKQGQAATARQALQFQPGAAPPSVFALVDVADGVPTGLGTLDEMVRTRPDPMVARHAIFARALTNRGVEVPALFEALAPSLRHLDTLREAQYLAHTRRDYWGSAAIGETILRHVPPNADSWAMYNTACSLAQAGDTERAMAWLWQAVESGWNDLRQLSNDPDLAPLWNDPRYHQLRQRLSAS